MKQRLLLALLMLLTSAGFLKADVTFTVPKGETATVTVKVSTGNTIVLEVGSVSKQLTGTASYTIDKDDEASQTVKIKNNGLLELTITGKADDLQISDKDLVSLTASNVGLTTLTGSTLTKLRTLNLSNNNLTSIDVSKAYVLETLNVADNKIVNLGILPSTLLDLNIANNGFSISGVTWDLTTALPKLTKLNISGNKLVDVKVPATCADANFTKGIQDFTHQSEYKPNGSYVKANENLDITDMGEKYGLSKNITSATEWKKLEQGTEDTFGETEDAHVNVAATLYRFYDNATKVYVDGTYECVLVRDNGFKYRVRVKIDKAKFKLKRATLDHGNWAATTVAGTPLTDGMDITQGNNLILRIDFTNDANYDLGKFITEGLVLTNDSKWDVNGATCQIAGTYVNATTNGTISIDAEIVAKEYTVAFDNNFEEGHVEVYAQDAKGEYTIKLEPNSKVAYNTKVKVVLIPNSVGIDPTLAMGGVNQKLEKDVAGKWYFITPIVRNTHFTPNFGEATYIMVSAKVNGSVLSVEPAEVKLVNGSTSVTLSSASTSVKLKRGETYQLIFVLSNSTILEKVTIGTSTEVEMTSAPGAAGFTNYTGSVVVPVADAVINISTKKVGIVTVNPSKVSNNTQTTVFDGKDHPFEFTTTPTGLEKGFVVTYSPTGKNEYTSAVPKDAGKYDVKLEYTAENRDPNYSYAAVTNYYVEILKATPVFTKLPTVTYNKETKKYEVSGETENKLKGEFTVNANGADPSKSHVVDVTFKPSAPDNANYNSVTFKQEVVVDGKPLERTSIKVVNDTEASVEVWNGGEKMMSNSAEYLEGTTLIVNVAYPEGVKSNEVSLVSAANKSISEKSVNTSERVKTFAYDVSSIDDELHVKINASFDKKYEVVLDKKVKVPYSKEGQGYPSTNIQVYDSKDLNTPLSGVSYTVSYEGVSGLPVNAGKYVVRVQIKAGNGFAAYNEVFKEKFEIEKAKTEITKLPSTTPVSLGQELRFSNFEGGLTNGVQGEFVWENLSDKPVDGKEYTAIFEPEDDLNYEKAECKVAVTVLDQRLVTYYTNFPGQTDITVKDKSGKYYESGDPVAKGTVLLITTATINSDLELASLSVAGATKNSDGTYTVGDSSIEISATFQVKTKPGNFKVTVPEYLRGTIITGGGEHVVAEGGTLSFTVATASADASKVSVKASNGTVTKGSNGRYTLSGLTANSTVTVSLSNPTALKVDIQKSYLNAGKYHVATVEVESDYTDGKFYYGDEITVVAYPESGVKFEKWSDGSKDQVHDIVLTGDLKLTATFSGTPTGIEDIMAASIATGKGCVWVRGIANADVTIVSIAGRVQARQRISGDTRIDVPAGIYVVVLESGSDVKRVKVIVK